MQFEDAVVVYFTTLGEKEDITKEYKYYKSLAKRLMGPIKVTVFRMAADAPNFGELKKDYRVGKLAAGRPDLRYFPNEATGDKKMDRSFSLPLDLKSSDFTPIIEEIESSFAAHVVDI